MTRISRNQVRYVRSLQQKKVRDDENVFVAEGHKCVEELLKAFTPVMIVVRSEEPVALKVKADCPVLEASAIETEQMSSLRTPQGVIGVFRKPAAAALPGITADGKEDAAGMLYLALDGIQDPGNLGTIIRTADWFGIRHIVCSRDTADCWNAKVVQATMGALARVTVHYTDLEVWLMQIRGQGAPNGTMNIYGTMLDGRNIYSPGAVPEKDRGVIVMGNEGNGISDGVRALVTHPLFIPPYPAGADTSESLNVSTATAVTLAEFRRQ